jgi:hypothetical protein
MQSIMPIPLSNEESKYGDKKSPGKIATRKTSQISILKRNVTKKTLEK